MRRALVGMCGAGLILSACGTWVVADQAAPAAQPKPVAPTSPLTGLPMPEGRPTTPVFVAKIDNTAPAAPQIGLDQADLVVQELVEGGVTRLAALFQTQTPDKIGHVRSMRATDIGIASPVQGQIIASGGASPTIERVKDAGIAVHLEDESAVGFTSDVGGRPYNRLFDVDALAKASEPPELTGDYFEFGAGIAAEPSAVPASDLTTRFSPETTTAWALDDEDHWMRTNGPEQAGSGFETDTLIVIRAEVADAGYRDVGGNPVPETIFEGSGDATIFEGGQALEVTWQKDDVASMVVFATGDGETVRLKPGKTWIELLPRDEGILDY